VRRLRSSRGTRALTDRRFARVPNAKLNRGSRSQIEFRYINLFNGSLGRNRHRERENPLGWFLGDDSRRREGANKRHCVTSFKPEAVSDEAVRNFCSRIKLQTRRKRPPLPSLIIFHRKLSLEPRRSRTRRSTANSYYAISRVTNNREPCSPFPFCP